MFENNYAPISVLLSTDGKCTIIVNGTLEEIDALYTKAKEVYNRLDSDGIFTISKDIQKNVKQPEWLGGRTDSKGQKCPKCGGDMEYVPAGVSKKTGRAYKSFWSCLKRKTQQCDGTSFAGN